MRDLKQCAVRGCALLMASTGGRARAACPGGWHWLPVRIRHEVQDAADEDRVGSTRHRLAIARACRWFTALGKLYGSGG